MNLHTSAKVLYNGTGATRIHPGFRLSHTTPFLSSAALTCSILSSLSSTLSWAPLSNGDAGVMMRNSFSSPPASLCGSCRA